MIVNGTLSVECKKCGKVNDFDSDESDFEITDSEVREQGNEITYTWEDTFECNNEDCDNEIEIECGVWEYPKGELNHAETKIEGATVINEYDYDLSEQVEL